MTTIQMTAWIPVIWQRAEMGLLGQMEEQRNNVTMETKITTMTAWTTALSHTAAITTHGIWELEKKIVTMAIQNNLTVVSKIAQHLLAEMAMFGKV